MGDAGVRAYMEQSRIFVGMVLILIFGEVLGLYGYVLGLFPRGQCGHLINLRQSDCCPSAQHQDQGLSESPCKPFSSNHHNRIRSYAVYIASLLFVGPSMDRRNGRISSIGHGVTGFV